MLSLSLSFYVAFGMGVRLLQPQNVLILSLYQGCAGPFMGLACFEHEAARPTQATVLRTCPPHLPVGVELEGRVLSGEHGDEYALRTSNTEPQEG